MIGLSANSCTLTLWTILEEKFNYLPLTIRDISRQLDYKSFVTPISMLQKMVVGYPFPVRAITPFDVWILKELISDNLSGSVSTKIPLYCRDLFVNFTNNVQRVEINMREINLHDERTGLRRPRGKKQLQFGYRLFKDMFFTDCGTESEGVNMSLFLRLFNRSLETLVIFLYTSNEWRPSVRLNSEFTVYMLSGCQIIVSNPRLKRVFKEFVIMNPKDSISEFIAKRQSEFQAVGWALRKGEYVHPRRGKCAETLFVSLL